MNTKQAAAYVGKSASTLTLDRKKRHLGIPFSKQTVGQGNVTYKREDLDAWKKAVIQSSTSNFKEPA